MAPTIKQSIIDDFERAYILNCDSVKQNFKMRNVSYDSPFDPTNKPPRQYIEDDKTLLDKPGRLNLREVTGSGLPLAGKLTEIG